MFAFGCLALGLVQAVNAEPLEVGVRAKVLNPFPVEKIKPDDEPRRTGKVYAIASVKPVPSERKLIKPVDGPSLRRLVELHLATQGFSERMYGEDPDIVITVDYGRGYLRNPYLLDSGRTASGAYGGSGAGAYPYGQADGPSLTITGGSRQLMSEKSAAYRARVAKAEYEKLFIQLTAWEKSSGGPVRGKQLWTTLMQVDDPDHRDLNRVAGEMLNAGAPFFGRVSQKPEVEVNPSLPDGGVRHDEARPLEPQPKDK